MTLLTDDEGYPRVCDGVFATAVTDMTGSVAVLYWARSMTYGTPAVLLEWSVQRIAPPPWLEVAGTLIALDYRCHARYGIFGIFTETAALSAQLLARGFDAQPVYEHLTKPENWGNLVLTAAHHLGEGSVKLTAPAFARTLRTRFSALPVLSHGPRVTEDPKLDDPTLPAFLYGIAIALDPASADPPEPARVKVIA